LKLPKLPIYAPLTLKRQGIAFRGAGFVMDYHRIISCVVISSLVKIDDERLQALLDEVQALRKFQS
jgi:hypothetical protein